MIKQYLQVTKPGIIFGNLISVIGVRGTDFIVEENP